MKNTYRYFGIVLICVAALASPACNQQKGEENTTSAVDNIPENAFPEQSTADNMSNEEMIKEGERLVLAMDCNICHSPKRMTEKGPEVIKEQMLSGFQAAEKLAPYDAATLANGWTLANPSFTAWVGPWGTSFSANITPDNETGIGRWQEQHFFRAMREGKFHGLENTRQILPPMPWEAFRHLTDEELRMIFVYLKSVKPVNNRVPDPIPPKGA